MFDELIQQIENLLSRKNPAVIAISGHGGSGKSTLADKLAQHFGIAKNQIVRTDGLHAVNYMHADDIFKHHDWVTIMDILLNIQTSVRLKYLKRDDKGKESIIDVPRPKLVIVEGIRLIRPEIVPYVDLSIWIDCPLKLATERAKERNRTQGDDEDEIALWDTKWVPESKQYYEQIAPQKIADVVYRDYK